MKFLWHFTRARLRDIGWSQPSQACTLQAQYSYVFMYFVILVSPDSIPHARMCCSIVMHIGVMTCLDVCAIVPSKVLADMCSRQRQLWPVYVLFKFCHVYLKRYMYLLVIMSSLNFINSCKI